MPKLNPTGHVIDLIHALHERAHADGR